MRAPFLVHWWLLTISSHRRRGIHEVYPRILQGHKHPNHSTVVPIMDSECQQTFGIWYTFSCPSTTFSRKWILVNFSFKCFPLCKHPLYFLQFSNCWGFQWLSQSSLDKCHIALENTWVTFKYVLILISNIIPQWWQNRFCMIAIPLDHEIFVPCCMSLNMFQCLLVYSLWELE